MNNPRSNAACTVYERRVVVSGGYYGVIINYHLKSVEVHDHVADKWSYMSNMIEKRVCHSSVAIKNKSFVIECYRNGRKTCEILDSTCKKMLCLYRNQFQ